MGPSAPRSRQDDDIDDFMASLIHKDAQSVPARPSRPSPLKRAQLHRRAASRPITTQKQPTSSLRAMSPVQLQKQAPTPKQKPAAASKPKKGLMKAVLAVLCLGAAIAGGILLWQGPVSSLLQPRSPFSNDILEQLGVPLYFPTKLPGTFKIETDSVTRPENDVVMFTITDDEGMRINITLQRQPEGINLDPLYAALTNMQDLQTKFGVVKTGTTSEQIDMTNLLTGRTWIIINTPAGTLDTVQLTNLINSLREVKA